MKTRERNEGHADSSSEVAESPIERTKAKILQRMNDQPDRTWTFSELITDSDQDTVTSVMAVNQLVLAGLVDHPAAGVNRLPRLSRLDTATANRVRLTADA